MTKASVLLVDDEEAAAGLVPEEFRLIQVDPREDSFAADVEKEVSRCELVLIDQELNLGVSLSLAASDGASLIGHFRSWARQKRSLLPPLVLISNNSQIYATEVPAVGPAVPLNGSFEGHEHRLAPVLDVEWILWKQDPGVSEKIKELTLGMREIKKSIDGGGASLDEVESLLKIPKGVPWHSLAIEQLRSARPPITQQKPEVEQPPRGPAGVMRWLLHRALPYPGVFVSNLFAAWLLGVSEDSFELLMNADADSALKKSVAKCRYAGPLKNFFGPRWWTSGIEHAGWLIQERVEKGENKQKVLDELSGGLLKPLGPIDTVVLWTSDFVESEIGNVQDAVQLHPPGWPVEAVEPWISTRSVEEDPVLASMVDPQDQDRTRN